MVGTAGTEYGMVGDRPSNSISTIFVDNVFTERKYVSEIWTKELKRKNKLDNYNLLDKISCLKKMKTLGPILPGRH